MRVTIGCPVCLQPLTIEYDPGEPRTYWEPGAPPGWWHADAAHTCNLVLYGSTWDAVELAAYYHADHQAYLKAESMV